MKLVTCVTRLDNLNSFKSQLEVKSNCSLLCVSRAMFSLLVFILLSIIFISQIFCDQYELKQEQGVTFLRATSAIALVRGQRGLTGSIRFYQDDNPMQPLIVDGTLLNLPPSNYVLRVHNFGDTSDACNLAGKQWYELYRFTVNSTDTGAYRLYFRDRNVGLHDEFSIIGRAISISPVGAGYDTDVVLSCQPIGLAGEEYYPKNDRRLFVNDLVAPYLAGLWKAQD